MKLSITFAILAVGLAPAWAQFAVRVSPSKIIGQKAVVPLALKNGLAEKVESVRAVVFLIDEHGKVAAQGTRWILGGDGSSGGLAVGATNAFLFVVASDRPFSSTNLTAKVTVTRVVLESGKLADPRRDVNVEPAWK